MRPQSSYAATVRLSISWLARNPQPSHLLTRIGGNDGSPRAADNLTRATRPLGKPRRCVTADHGTLCLSLRRWTIGQHGVWGGLVAADRAALRRRWLASPHEYGRALPILDRSWNGPSATSHAGRGGRPATAAGTSRHAVSSIRAVRMARALLRHLTAAAPRPEDIDARRPGRWLMADSARAWPIQAGTAVRRRAASRSRRAARSGGNHGERDTRPSA
jgi:hypothetical protein